MLEESGLRIWNVQYNSHKKEMAVKGLAAPFIGKDVPSL
jgi:hypothetical protein